MPSDGIRIPLFWNYRDAKLIAESRHDDEKVIRVRVRIVPDPPKRKAGGAK